jgi:hypothetical protein
MRTPTLLIAIALTASLLAPVLPAAAEEQEPSPQPEWAPVEDATIRPGVQITGVGGCTTNFIFYETHETEAGTPDFDIYIGTAAHCFGGSGETAGCTSPGAELGSTADIEGADHPGELAYSSWTTMDQVAEEDSTVCRFNDFALVRLDPRDHDKVNPTLLFYGGPDALLTDGTSFGDEVFSYGNSSLRLGIATLSPKRGYSMGTHTSGWSHQVYMVTPGIFGDSGSAFVDEQGLAMGVIVTIQIAPFTASNGVTDLDNSLRYLEEHTDMDVHLALGTEPFEDRLVPPLP